MSDYERGIPSSKSSRSPRHRLRARICIPCEGIQQRYNNDRYNDGMCSQTISLQPSSASRSPPPQTRRQARYDAQTSVSSSDLLALQTGSSGLVATGQYDYSARRRRTKADLSNPASSPSSRAHAFCIVSSSPVEVEHIHIDRLMTCIHISSMFLHVRYITRR